MGDKAARMTRQRRVILESLSKITSHPTADEVYAIVRAELPRVSLGTIYRNLELLSSRGMVQKLDQSPGQRRFDGNIAPHFHGRCLQCGRIIDLPSKPEADMQELLDSNNGFEITGYRLEFLGSCANCIR